MSNSQFFLTILDDLEIDDESNPLQVIYSTLDSLENEYCEVDELEDTTLDHLITYIHTH